MARANGKVILLGEHAVVYGVPAIAAGIARGARAVARDAAEACLRLGDQSVVLGDGSEVATAFGALLAELHAGPLAVEVELELPPGAGLGASAAIGVAIARAVLQARGEPANLERELLGASAWERIFHGNPSGIDAAAAAYGGCLLYSRADGVQPMHVARPLSLVVALAGPPASTRSMLEHVEKLRERRPAVFEKTLLGIRALVQNAKLCIESGDLVALGRLMDLNQMLLSGLFVSTEALERACTLARDAGALGAKLTGAGGGGAVIALVETDPTPVLEAFRGAGLDCFPTTIEPSAGAEVRA